MFEWMQKYKAWILIFVLIAMTGFGAWGYVAQMAQGGDQVYGSFQLPGSDEKTEVSFLEWQQAYRFVTGPIGGRFLDFGIPDAPGTQDDEAKAWCFLAATRAADEAGIVIDPKQVDNFAAIVGMQMFGRRVDLERNIRKQVGDGLYDSVAQMLKVETFLSLRATGSLFGEESRNVKDPVRQETAELVDRWRQTVDEVKVSMVAFEKGEADQYRLDLEKDEEKLKLIKWWNEAPAAMKKEKEIPDRVKVEVAWIRHLEDDQRAFDKVFAERFAEATKDVEVTDLQLTNRFQAHQGAYAGLIELETERLKREREEAGEEPTGDQPAEFDLVRERLRQEYKIGSLAKNLQEEVAALPGDQSMKELAEAKGFRFVALDWTESVELQKNPDFGKPRWVLDLFRKAKALDAEMTTGKPLVVPNANERYLEGGFYDEPGDLIAVIRFMGYEAARDPELNEVLEWALDRYASERADEEVKERAEAFRAKIDAKIEELLAERRKELEAERDKNVAAAVEKDGLSREKDEDKEKIAAIERAEQERIDSILRTEGLAKEAEAFDAVIAAEKVETFDSGWLSTASVANGSMNRFEDDPTPAERRRRLLRSYQRLSSLSNAGAGRVGAADYDPAAELAVVCLVREKREPAVEKFFLEPRNLRMGTSFQRPTPFSYENMKKTSFFSLNAPELEAAKKQEEERQKREREREAARQRALEEARRKAAAENADANPNAANPDAQPPAGTQPAVPLPALPDVNAPAKPDPNAPDPAGGYKPGPAGGTEKPAEQPKPAPAGGTEKPAEQPKPAPAGGGL